MLFEKKILIKFSEADPEGIMFFNQALQISHECLEEFWSNTKVGWGHWFKNPEIAVPIRHCACDFYKPLYAGQNYVARLSVAQVKESSVTFNCEFFQNDILHAKTSSTHVFVDRKTFKKISIPENIKNILL